MEHITIEEYFKPHRTNLLIDVRSPGEYNQGHIPGAINLPLFTDEERKQVGTMYKQVSPEKAFMKGLDIVGPKMSFFVKEIKKYSPDQVTVQCWRGGKRSQSVTWLLNFAGISANYLSGGYKSFRNYILNNVLTDDIKLIVLGGKTGIGKTEFLQKLKDRGEQIIDLEALANHKGSAFGHLGEPTQPSNEQYENILAQEIIQLDKEKRIWVENESRMIGSNPVPASLWVKMKKAPLLNIEVDPEIRYQNILRDYGQFTKEELTLCFKKIEKKLGSQNMKDAIDAININDLKSAINIATKYYDKTYEYNLTINTSPNKHFLLLPGDNLGIKTSSIIDYANRFIRFD